VFPVADAPGFADGEHALVDAFPYAVAREVELARSFSRIVGILPITRSGDTGRHRAGSRWWIFSGCHENSPPQNRQGDREEAISAAQSASVEDVEKAGGVRADVKLGRWRALAAASLFRRNEPRSRDRACCDHQSVSVIS